MLSALFTLTSPQSNCPILSFLGIPARTLTNFFFKPSQQVLSNRQAIIINEQTYQATWKEIQGVEKKINIIFLSLPNSPSEKYQSLKVIIEKITKASHAMFQQHKNFQNHIKNLFNMNFTPAQQTTFNTIITKEIALATNRLSAVKNTLIESQKIQADFLLKQNLSNITYPVVRTAAAAAA